MIHNLIFDLDINTTSDVNVARLNICTGLTVLLDVYFHFWHKVNAAIVFYNETFILYYQ